MKRLLAIVLGLMIWSASSGLIQIAHEQQHEASGVPHDESRCNICATLHTALDLPTIFVLHIIVQRRPELPEPVVEILLSRPLPLDKSSRGPPVC